MPRISTLVAKLARALGSHHQALAELRWIKEALSKHPDSSPGLLAEKLLKRAGGWPLQYLLGSQPFGSLDIITRPPTLIPRPETEYWTLRLAQILRPHTSEDTPFRVLDLCTGTACIPLLLCASLPPRSVSALAVDISPAAVGLADENITRCGFRNSDGNIVHVECLDIFDRGFVRSLKRCVNAWEPFNVLTANPPYIPREEYDKLSPTVRAFEDPLALLGEAPSVAASSADKMEYRRQGLSFYVHIASLIQNEGLVRPGGHIALEVGHTQAPIVKRMLQPIVRSADIWTDPWGVERVVYARM